MGWIRHHAIVVTVDIDSIEEIHKKAAEIFPHVSSIVPGSTNDYSSFLVPADGSKEGWKTSNEFDVKRDEFIAYLKDSKQFPDWVEVAYGECEAVVTRSDSN